MSTKRSVIALVLSPLTLAPAAAIRVPQTRQDYVQAVAEGKGATALETIHSDQPLRRV